MKKRIVIVAVPLVILAVALAQGSILLLRLFFLYVLVLLLSYTWVRQGIRGLQAQAKKLPEHCQVGDWIDEEVIIANTVRLPKLLVKVRDNTDMPGHTSLIAVNLGSRSSYLWHNNVYCQRRGLYRLGSLTATITDPFGLFSLSLSLGEAHQILVYPASVSLPFFWQLSQQEASYGPARLLASESAPDAARVREYTTSDSFGRIHWPSTARMGRLMAKVFDASRPSKASKNIWIIADMYQDSNLGEGDESTEEYCITIATSLVKEYITGGRPVGLVAIGDRPYSFSPERGEYHLQHMLEALAVMKAAGRIPIERLVSDRTGSFGVNSAMVVITPSVTERVTAALRHANNRGIMVAAVLLDPHSFGGTASAVSVAGNLVASGIQAYVVRRGDELTKVLDSRAARLTYAGIQHESQ